MQVERRGEASNKAEDHEEAAESAAGERLQGVGHCDRQLHCLWCYCQAKKLGPFGVRALDTQMARVNLLHVS